MAGDEQTYGFPSAKRRGNQTHRIFPVALPGFPSFEAMLEIDPINRTSPASGEPVGEARHCFPVLTVLGTAGLALFIAISLLRNHHTNAAPAPAAAGGIELKPLSSSSPDQTPPLSRNSWVPSTNSSPPLLATQPPWWP
jgi:hypothetical protein